MRKLCGFVRLLCGGGGGVTVAGFFRLRGLFASGVGILLETSSSACVGDGADDGDDGGVA